MRSRRPKFPAPVSDTCWPWSGYLDSGGYGCLGRHKRVHREAWRLTRGPIPAGMMVCHHCDVRHCFNPDHLFLGTATDNNADREAKGRTAHGEHSGQAKLAAAAVTQIRKEYAAGTRQTALAKKWGMSQSTISDIVRGNYWQKAPGERIRRAGHRHMTPEERRTVGALLRQGVLQAEVARQFGVTQAAISYLKRRRLCE